MSASVVLLGNDIHRPLNEMAAWQVERIRERFAIPPEQIVSIQSRKDIPRVRAETIIRGRPGALSRSFQAVKLFTYLARLSHRRSRVIHWVGNGNRALRLALIAFTRITGRRLVWSPYGILPGPWPKGSVTVIAPHQKVLDGIGAEGAVIPPFCSELPAFEERAWNGRMLFCSVPPKAEEFGERGIVAVTDAIAELSRSGDNVHLTLLNRYEWLHEPLDRLAARTPAVEVVSKYIPDMLSYMRDFSALIIPYEAPHLAQVPQSAVEACAAGLPCIVRRDLAFADELVSSGAGVTYETASDLAKAAEEIRSDFSGYRRRARALAERLFAATPGLDAVAKVYKQLQGIELTSGKP